MSNQSRVPFTSTCIGRRYFALTKLSPLFIDTRKPPEHDVEHPRPPGCIKRSERHRRVVGIHHVDEEGPFVERERLRLALLALDEQTAVGGRHFNLAVRPRINAGEA